ncbi:hypothetical protein ACGFYQ_01640 [Streptomyces sp. NPDC048258]|uniref:hypothetical protein n=1 Tax=Streptomyces sp. NPDC048258 TaxID=3365527 RepID=UPI00371E8373
MVMMVSETRTADRIKQAAESVSQEDGVAFLEHVHESWTEVSKALSRSIILYLLVVALFELLVGNKEDLRFTVAGFQFVNSATLQKCLPALAGYLYYESVMQMCRWLDCEQAFDLFYKKFHEPLYGQGMHLLLKPSGGVWNIGTKYSGHSTAGKLGAAAQAVVGYLCLIVIPVIFLGHASYLLIDRYGWSDPLTVVSFTLSSAFLLFGIVFSQFWRSS